MDLPGVLPNLKSYLVRIAHNIIVCLVYPRKGPWVHVGPGYFFLFWGAVIWVKFRIPDSVLLVHSIIDTISSDNSAFNKNGFIKFYPPLTGIINSSSGEGGGGNPPNPVNLHLTVAYC